MGGRLVVNNHPQQPSSESSDSLGRFKLNAVTAGDARKLVLDLPDESVSVVVTSPPYWGQRTSEGNGVEDDPREYLRELQELFRSLLPKMTTDGILWLNIGDAYNTPVNWRPDDHSYSSLGPDGSGLSPDNSAYTKPRHKRKAFIERGTWLTYGNLLALPYRLVVGMQDDGWIFRGEVIWRKRNPMPEGLCRRPHRGHESLYLFARDEGHSFRTKPPVPSVWEFPNEKIVGKAHSSRFPLALPTRCIDAFGQADMRGRVVLDPFSGSGTTGISAIRAGADYVGFEIDEAQVQASNERLRDESREAAAREASAADAAQGATATRASQVLRGRAIREWSRRNGFAVGDRGRVPARVQAAYETANSPRLSEGPEGAARLG